MIKKLNWDTDFFDIEIGELTINEEFNISQANKYDLLYVKSNKEFDLKIENFINSFSEKKIVFSKSIQSTFVDDENIFSIKGKDYNSNEIYELAFESGKYSRFYLDTKLEKSKFQELYKKWVDNSISNIFADDLLIYIHNGKAEGFVTYKINNKTATIGLIAVSPTQQGKGIGGKLIKTVENVLFKNKVKTLLIPTQQSNKLACDFYKKQGYEIHETTYIKHYWKK